MHHLYRVAERDQPTETFDERNGSFHEYRFEGPADQELACQEGIIFPRTMINVGNDPWSTDISQSTQETGLPSELLMRSFGSQTVRKRHFDDYALPTSGLGMKNLSLSTYHMNVRDGVGIPFAMKLLTDSMHMTSEENSGESRIDVFALCVKHNSGLCFKRKAHLDRARAGVL